MTRIVHAAPLCLIVLVLSAGGVLVAAEENAKDSKQSPAAKEAKEKGEAAQEEKKEDEKGKAVEKKSSDAKPDTHTVKKEPFKIEVELDGVFESATMHEVILRPDQWTSFRVLSAVEHGKRVKRGDLLVTLDTEKIDQAIADLRAEQQVADLDFKIAEEDLRLLEVTTQLDLEAGSRVRKYDEEDLKYYFDVTAPMAKKSADFMLKSNRWYLEYQEEELRQLEKMYKADDLTEETEEIVLTRARNALEEMKFMFENYKTRHDRTVKTVLPRRDVQTKEAARRADLLWSKTKLSLPVALKKAQLAMEKTIIERARAKEKLDEMLADRAAMIVKAPADGVVYHGKCTRGKFSGAGTITENLRPGGSLTANQAFMTVVQTRPMFIRSSVPEKQLQYVRPGLKGTAKPTAFPDARLTTIVNQVDAIPLSQGSFGSRITVELDAQAGALMPGMACKVKLVPYRKSNVLTIPPKTLFTDELDDQKQYVYVQDKSDKPKKQVVKVGKRTDKKVEILSGISAGDKVLLERPKDEK